MNLELSSVITLYFTSCGLRVLWKSQLVSDSHFLYLCYYHLSCMGSTHA